MIKNIIFDCSDTLLRSGAMDFLCSLTGDKERATKIHRALFLSPVWYDYDRGTVSPEQLEQALLPLLDEEDRSIGKTYIGGWDRHYTINPGIPELISDLKAQGYRLYVLSDYPPCFERLWAQFSDLFGRFDGRMVSYEEGVKKADGELFERLLQKYNLKAEECIFTDDLPSYVAIAQQYGIRSFVFTDVATLRKDLNI